MDRHKKLLLTKYILYKFYIWYEESFDNGKENDLSILKSLKLIFLLATINVDRKGENLLDMGFKFAAMPYGPVEIEIYDWHKSNALNDIININGLNFSNLKNIINEKSISEEEKDLIDNNLEILKSKNYYLITKSAPYLIDLTHKFSSWKNNYREALKQKRFSQPIPDVDIKNDVLHYSL